MDEIKPYREIIYLKDHVETYCDDMAIATIPNPNGFEIQYGDSFNITIEHKDIGWIRKDDFSASSILSPPYVKDFLIDTFRLFNAKNSLDKYALKPGTDERRHVTGISWLFAMIGFRTIFLGNVDSTDEKTSRTQPEHSCDILLSDATCIFVVDCTSSTPFGNKITKIYNTAKYVKENINEECRKPSLTHAYYIMPLVSFWYNRFYKLKLNALATIIKGVFVSFTVLHRQQTFSFMPEPCMAAFANLEISCF